MTIFKKSKNIYNLIFFLILASTQYLKPISNCLSDCKNCLKNYPSSCQIIENEKSCLPEFQYNKDIKECALRLTFESSFNKYYFTNFTKTPSPKQQTEWADAITTECSLIDQNEQHKYFTAIGMFNDVSSINKKFQISQHHQNYILSFNLIRNNWLPNNDFLIVDVQADNQLISSNQISYDAKQSAKSNNLITCNNQALSAEKFQIRINYKAFQTDSIKITFTGYLFTSLWGITNIKFIPGCEKFTVFNKLNGNCDLCNVGYFPEFKPTKTDVQKENQILKCKKCSFACLQCLSEKYCKSCIKGYKIAINNCVADEQQFAYVKFAKYENVEQVKCKILQQNLFKNQQNKIISVTSLEQTKKSYSVGYLEFQFIYNTIFKKMDSKVIVQMDGKFLIQISTVNLTNKGFEACNQNSNQRYSIQKFIVPISNVSTTTKFVFKKVKGGQNCKFGFANLQIACEVKALVPQHVSEEPIPVIIPKIEQSPKISNQTFKVQNITKLEQIVIPPTSIKQASVIEKLINPKIQVVLSNVQEQKKITEITSLEVNKTIQKKHKINDIEKVPEIKQIQKPKLIQPIPQNKLQIDPLKKQNVTKPAQSAKNESNLKIAKQEQPAETKSNVINLTIKNQSLTSKAQSKNIEIVPIRPTPILEVKSTLQPSIQHLSLSKNGKSFLIVKLNLKNSSQLSTKGNIVIKLTSDEMDKDGKHIITYIDEYKDIQQLKNDLPSSEMSNTFLFEVNSTFLNKNIQILNKIDLVAATEDNKSTLQLLKNNPQKVTSFSIQRFDDLQFESQQILNVFDNLFTTFAWIIMIVALLFTLMGKLFLVEQSLISLQKLFLTIYIYTSYSPASILNTISGLRRLENFDIMAHNHLKTIEQWLFGDMVQNSPLKFTLFHKDINFTRNFIPIILPLLIICLWFVIVSIYNRFLNKAPLQINQQQKQDQLNDDEKLEQIESQNVSQDQTLSHRFKTEICHQIMNKKLNYFMQILKLTYLPILFLSLKQLHNLAYPIGYSGQGFNTAFCQIMFISRIIISIVIVLYASRQYFKLQYDRFVQLFSVIYFKKIPKYYLPTQHHRIVFPIIRQSKIFIFAFLIAIFGDNAIPISIVLIVFYTIEMVYAWYFEIYQDSLYFKFEVTETILFCVLFVIHFILNFITQSVSKNGYLAFGYIYMAISVVLIINSFSKSSYFVYDHFKKIKKGTRITEKQATLPSRLQSII